MLFQRLGVFPRPRSMSRKRAPFRARWSDTVRMLRVELRHLQAVASVMDVDAWSGLANGKIRADAKTLSPAVLLRCRCAVGLLVIPADGFLDWKDNVRAIGLTLKALRAASAYRVMPGNACYAPWIQAEGGGRSAPPPEARPQPQPEPVRPSVPLVDAALLVATFALLGGYDVTLIGGTSQLLTDRVAYRGAYRAAARAVHPDRCGRDETRFKRLQAAAAILDRHHGV